MRFPDEKIFTAAEEFIRLRERLRTDNKKLVFTNGCFDVLHAGHCSYLFEARKLGDFLVVGVNTDESVRRLKGAGRPIVALERRMYVLASLECVDAVIPFEQDTPLELIMAVKPDILVKGEDYEIDEIVGAKEIIQWGGKVVRVPLLRNSSTTGIIEAITKFVETVKASKNEKKT